MLINVGARTDIAAHYSEWLMNRLREGYVLVRNPRFADKVTRYSLSPDVVDCLIFCTKDPAPMLPHLAELRAMGHAVYFFVTITSYGRDIEPRVPGYHAVMESFHELSARLGRDCVCWRYDPVLVTPRYTVEHHLRCFEEMAAALAGDTERCIFSFVELYQKLAVTFPELRAVTGAERAALAQGMGQIAARYGLRLQTCGDGRDYTAYGIERSGCITVPVLEKATGRELKALKLQPARPGCGCVHSSDIGAYDTCPNGCRYCYATRDHAQAWQNYRRHDPASPLLGGPLLPSDTVTDAKQKSFGTAQGQQLSFF